MAQDNFQFGYGQQNPMIPYQSENPKFHRSGEGVQSMPELLSEGRVETLHMSREKERNRFEDILTLQSSGEIRIMMHDRRYDEEKKDWIIFLVYYQNKFTEKEEAQQKRLNISQNVRNK